MLRYANGVVKANPDLVGPFLPAAKMLGLDALHMAVEVPIGEIRGAKFHDLDRDSRWGADDPPLAQWEIHLDGVDDLGNTIVDTSTTNDTGVYSFTVAAGVYTVTEVCPPTAAWIQTLPAPLGDVCGSGVHTLTVDAGGVYEPYDFGNYLLKVDLPVYMPIVMKSYQ